MNQFSVFQRAIMLLLLLLISFPGLAQEKAEEVKKGISIVLTVYSGIPNPRWWIPEGEEFEKLTYLIRTMRTAEDSLFNYDEWNKPGYAIFRITAHGLDDLPGSIHVWRDMAYIPQNGEMPPLYATGTTELYDLLVKQAEERGYEEFFLNYHKLKRKNNE